MARAFLILTLSFLLVTIRRTSAHVAAGVYRPELPNDFTVVDQRKKLRIIHWFVGWGTNKDFDLAGLEAVASRGELPMITWEPGAGVPNDPAWTLRDAVLSGKNDAYIESWAQGMAAYCKPVLLRFAHEMHATSYPWGLGVNGNTAQDYVDAYRHVHDIFARYNAHNVRWVWNPNTMGTTLAATYIPTYASLYPGNAFVDWVGLDIYNTGTDVDWGAPFWRSFGEVLTEPYKALEAIAPIKPVILPEIGSVETGGSKAQWITDMFSQLPAGFPGVRSVVWFDVDKEAHWELDSSASALAAWEACIH